MSSGTQRRALHRCQSEEMKILNISFARVGTEPILCRIYSHMIMMMIYMMIMNKKVEVAQCSIFSQEVIVDTGLM